MAEVALPAEADRGYEAEEDEGAVEAAQLLASTRALITRISRATESGVE